MSSRLAEKKQVEQPVFPEREAVFEQSEPGLPESMQQRHRQPRSLYGQNAAQGEGD